MAFHCTNNPWSDPCIPLQQHLIITLFILLPALAIFAFLHDCLWVFNSSSLFTALLQRKGVLQSRSLKFHFLNKAFLENLTQNMSSIIPLLVFMGFFFLSCENIKCYCLIFLFIGNLMFPLMFHESRMYADVLLNIILIIPRILTGIYTQ